MPMWLLKFPVLHVIYISMKFSLQFTRGSNEAFNFPPASWFLVIFVMCWVEIQINMIIQLMMYNTLIKNSFAANLS